MAAAVGPTFLGIGAQKAGTTWLYKMLCAHPDVGMPAQKELHFWDRDAADAVGIERYRHLFAVLSGKARGEITPSYAVLPPERITLIRQHFPELRLLYVLRNPLERAWSHARMELSRQFPAGLPQDFPLSPWLEQQFRSEASLSRGDYATCLKNWLKEYPQEQLQVSLYEDLRQDHRGFLEACARHIGVDPDFYRRMDQALLSASVYPEQEVLEIPRLNLPAIPPPESLPMLLELYAPRIQAAEREFGYPLMQLWLADYR
ncbi:MAG TPA: sulfotransferase [Gammaproteobacteria bacterium]|jgi:hypothetical protein